MKLYFFNEAQGQRDYRRKNRVCREDPSSVDSVIRPSNDIYSLLFASSFRKILYDEIQWKAAVADGAKQASEEKSQQEFRAKIKMPDWLPKGPEDGPVDPPPSRL